MFYPNPKNKQSKKKPTLSKNQKSEINGAVKTKVGGPYEYTPKQLLNLTQIPKSPSGPPKTKNDPKIRSTV